MSSHGKAKSSPKGSKIRKATPDGQCVLGRRWAWELRCLGIDRSLSGGQETGSLTIWKQLDAVDQGLGIAPKGIIPHSLTSCTQGSTAASLIAAKN